MDCFGTYFTHVQTCDVTRVQSATEWTASRTYFTHVQTCRCFKDVMTYSHLPRVRMPLPHVWQALMIFFRATKIPTLNDMASEMGYNGLTGGSPCRLRASMLLACGRCAGHRQANRVLKKVVEADATSLRNIRLAGSSTLRYFQLFGVVERDTKHVNLYNLGCLNSHIVTIHFWETHLGVWFSSSHQVFSALSQVTLA